MPPPLPFDEIMSDAGLRFWYLATFGAGLPPAYPSLERVPLALFGEFLYLRRVFG